jgi:diguanylate cyclase (GGDEF)-like protein
LDKFKNINDTYGHQISDAILVLFAKRIKKILKKDDIIARLGGDEFICILHNTNNNTYTHNLTHRILKAGETAYKIQGKSIYCGVTIGIVYYPEGGKTAATLLKHVDFSLYDAKKNKHKWQVYSKGIDTQYLSLLKLEKTLEDAFLNESFYLSYQPQIELKTHLTHRPLPRS